MAGRCGSATPRTARAGPCRSRPRLDRDPGGYIAAAHPSPETSDYVFYSVAAGRSASRPYTCESAGYLADAGIPPLHRRPAPALAAPRIRCRQPAPLGGGRTDLAVMLPYLACYMGHADLRGTQVLPEADRRRLPRGDGQGPGPVRATSSPSRPGPSREPAARAATGSCRALAVEVLHQPPGRGTRRLPETVSSYRDAMKLLLTWFRTRSAYRPEKLRLADIDRPRICGPGLAGDRRCSPPPATAPGGDQVVLPLTAVSSPTASGSPRSSRSGRRDPAPQLHLAQLRRTGTAALSGVAARSARVQELYDHHRVGADADPLSPATTARSAGPRSTQRHLNIRDLLTPMSPPPR